MASEPQSETIMLLDRIVIGVDFNAASVAAARWTARSFAPQAELVLIHCVPSGNPSAKGVEESIARAGRKLEALREELGYDRTRTGVCVGIPSDCIAEAAARVEADLVVVGPHNRYPQSIDEMGSTPEALVSRSCAPVLVSTGDLRGPPRRLLLSVQGLEVSAFVFEWARAVEARSGAQLSVVHLGIALCDADAEQELTSSSPRSKALADGLPRYDRLSPSSPPAIRRLFQEARRTGLTGAAR
jgi:nucleotide-binding universal stress UspA family protein